jgi:hypothetical protein
VGTTELGGICVSSMETRGASDDVGSDLITTYDDNDDHDTIHGHQ